MSAHSAVLLLDSGLRVVDALLNYKDPRGLPALPPLASSEQNTYADILRDPSQIIGELKERNLKSEEWDHSVKVEITNDCRIRDTPMNMRVYWLDYEGQAIDHGSAEYGETWKQSTFISHPWLICVHNPGDPSDNQLICVLTVSDPCCTQYELRVSCDDHGCLKLTHSGTASITGQLAFHSTEDSLSSKELITITEDERTQLGLLLPKSKEKLLSSEDDSKSTDPTLLSSLIPKYVKLECEEYPLLSEWQLRCEIGLVDKYPALLHVLHDELSQIETVLKRHSTEAILLWMKSSAPVYLNSDYRYHCTTKGEIRELDDPQAPAESMCFHPDPSWLTDHGNLAEKAGCVEIYRVSDWFKERGYMPMVLLHELGHAFHWAIGFHRDDVKRCWQNAKESTDPPLYRDIPFIFRDATQTRREAYALTNQMEYFSELTECFFGLNDFFPFVRSELQSYDPEGFEVMSKIWSMQSSDLDREMQWAKDTRDDSDENVHTE